jgi:hypothetical protein
LVPLVGGNIGYPDPEREVCDRRGRFDGNDWAPRFGIQTSVDLQQSHLILRGSGREIDDLGQPGIKP